MKRSLIDEAKKCLSIQDIRLNSSKVWIAESFDPVFPNVELLDLQLRHRTKQHRVVEFTPQNGEEIASQQKVVIFHYECAVRIIPDSTTSRSESSQKSKEPTVLGEIEAEFFAYYTLTESASNEALTEFGLYNVGYHVWPYWREYLSSVAGRLRLPPLALPMYSLPNYKNRSTATNKESDDALPAKA